MNSAVYTHLLKSLCLLILISSSGCSLFISSASNKLATNLSLSIKSQKDPETVKAALPSYLLMLDAMITGDEENSELLRSAANLNSSYGALFVSDTSRKKIFADKAMQYASNALCIEVKEACNITTLPFEKFESLVLTIDKETLPAYFTIAAAWAGWIQAYSDDWNAIAQLSRIESIMKRVIAIDERYENGNAHIYLGILATVVPPAMGGHAEQAKQHFQHAIDLSAGKNLMAKVYFAERYARLVFDRTLHDQLLNQVIDAKPVDKEMTLSNSIAKLKARELLESANDYF